MNSWWCGLVLAAMSLPGGVSAQTPSREPRFEVTGAAGLQAGADLAAQNGDLRANSTPPQPFTLFTTESRVAQSWLTEGRVGWRVTPRITVEGRLGYSRPTLEVSAGADTEGAPPITIVERIDQYVVDAGVVIRLDEVRIAGLMPYAAAGAGYLRQLHEGLTVIEQGHVYHVGGGVNRELWTPNGRLVRAAGLRVDARVYFLAGGVAPDVVTQGTVTAGIFVRF